MASIPQPSTVQHTTAIGRRMRLCRASRTSAFFFVSARKRKQTVAGAKFSQSPCRACAPAHKTSAITQQAQTESTFLDYIRFQVNQNPPPAAQSINRRVGTAERAMRREFPEAARLFAPGFQNWYWRQSPISGVAAAEGVVRHVRTKSQATSSPRALRSRLFRSPTCF
jgi:hypothetical protein